MKTNVQKWLLGIVVALAACLPLASDAKANGFVFNKAGDEVLDTSTGLVWKRCSLGQTLSGQSCLGTAQVFTFDEAAAAVRSHSGWKVPRADQLVSLRVCSNGERQWTGDSDLIGGGEGRRRACAKGSNQPSINTSVFPGTPAMGFMTSSLEGLQRAVWVVDFHDGIVKVGYLNHGGYRYAVRLVRASQLLGGDAALEFVLGRPAYKQGDFAPEVWAQGGAMEQSLGSVTLPWEPKSNSKPLALPSIAPTVDLQKLATQLKGVALADTHQAPVVGSVSPLQLTQPLREAIQPRTASLPPKGEFETTAAYDARKQQADQAAKDSAEQAYLSAVRAFNAAQIDFKQQQAKQEADNANARAHAEARKTDPSAYRSAMLKAWDLVTHASLGDPVLQDVAYDADRQVFTAKLLSSRGSLVGEVVAPVPLALAPEFKADLLSGKIAPKVTFAYPSMRLDWALIENSAQRSARFAAAQGSIDSLEALIREFPNAPEVEAAKRRVKALIAQEFSNANASSTLQAVINKYPSADEAPAARKRVEQLRLAEQRAEREAQEAQRRAEREAQEAARRQRE